MSEPRRILDADARRLLDEGATPFERDLLESWSAEQPSPAARARALAIAGAAAGTLVAATAATAAASATGVGTAAGATGAGTASGAGGASVGIAFAMKWGILFVAIAASAVASIVVLGSSRTPTEDGAPAVVATAALPSTATAAPPAIEPKAISPADLPAAAPTAAVTAAAVAPSVATPGTTAASHGHAALAAPGDSSLAEEIASFDRARAALDAGDADRALVLVDAYEKRFPAGTFVQEAEVLRVQALARKGDSAGARRVGQRFLAAHPTSPHAARIRAILDASNP